MGWKHLTFLGVLTFKIEDYSRRYLHVQVHVLNADYFLCTKWTILFFFGITNQNMVNIIVCFIVLYLTLRSQNDLTAAPPSPSIAVGEAEWG